jgi:hypothetical protein
MRALGQVRSDEARAALVHLAETEMDIDWVWEEIPYVIANYGPDVIPEIDAAIERTRDTFITCATLMDCMKQIAVQHPDTEPHYHSKIIDLLRESGKNDPGLNGSLISRIIDNKLEEALPVAKVAFDQDHVDVMFAGDYDDLLVEFGHKEPDPNKRHPLPFTGLVMPDKLAPEKSIKELREERKQRKKAEREAKQNKKKK